MRFQLCDSTVAGILHTIMFNRALGLVRPREVDSELFEITYCGDAATEKKIEEKIDLFLAWVEKHPNKKSQVCLSFYETRNKQMAWFSSKVERLYWEQWCIQLQVIPPAPLRAKPFYDRAHYGDAPETMMDERQKRHAALELALRSVIMQVLQIVNEKKGSHSTCCPLRCCDFIPFRNCHSQFF
jgi:autophagy-related protein 101